MDKIIDGALGIISVVLMLGGGNYSLQKLHSWGRRTAFEQLFKAQEALKASPRN